nr:MAG TPA: Cytosine specific methyltransferase [Caudoviricetes sp.]
MKHLKVLGVSAGQGALLFPFKENLVANIEPRAVFHTKNEEQWRLNFGDIPFFRNELPDNIKADVIISSPDCGASSIMRLSKVKQLGKPEDNKSLNLVIQAINKYRPKVFLLENLPRLVTLLPKEFFEIQVPGYKLIYHQRSVVDFGNSQVSRKRLIIIGIKIKSKSYLNRFDNIFRVDTPVSSRKLLECSYFKENNDNYMPPLNKVLAMYDYRALPEKKNLTVKQIKKLWRTDFKDEKKWPIKTAKMSTLPGVYRLENDKPPLTLRPADRQFRPDGYPLGIKDFKNIMGFPDEYKIYMDKDNYLYWLNKARYTIAKGSVYQVGKWFKKCILS